jgi:ribonuclease HI
LIRSTYTKTAVIETITAHPLEAIQAYTDGFAFNATLNDGYGAVIIYPSVHYDDNPIILEPCWRYCSKYTAEIFAVEKILRKILVHLLKNVSTTPIYIVVFSDSKSVHRSIDRFLSNRYLQHVATKQ